MTTCTHLDTITVQAGQRVGQGQQIGTVGMTGIAIWYHLHFEVLVSGVSVSPLEWWDAKWIRDRVNRPLKEAGLPEIGGAGAVADDGPARPIRAARRRAR